MSRNVRSAGRSWGPQLGKWLRQRELAGDARAGEFARVKARREQYDFLRHNWAWLSGGALTLLLCFAVGAYFAPDGFLRGFVFGVGAATTFALVVILVLQTTGTASTLMGGTAEQWTASELRKLRRAGWRVVHSVRLRPWDIDHVLIGPGGVFAIETKWSATPWQLAPVEDRVLEAVDQANRNAKDLRMWHDFKKAGIDVVNPVVMLWSRGLTSLPDDETLQQVEGTWVVVGRAAKRWRESLPDNVLSRGTVKALYRALDDHVRQRDARDKPTPPSIQAIFIKGCLACLAALISCIGVLYAVPLALSHAYLWPLAVAPGLLSLLLLRVPKARFLGLGGISGTVGVPMLVLGYWLSAW